MIELWEHDPQIRGRVDKLALDRAATSADRRLADPQVLIGEPAIAAAHCRRLLSWSAS